ncbi:MAG: type II methionyl aminopeptidase [Nanobdellota archaeon]
MSHEDWLKAGEITSKAREYAKSLVKPGNKLLDVAEKTESKIKELGGNVGFPINISMNEIAAHYTPIPDDELVFDNQVVKIDIGVEVNGAIGDSAVTVDLSGKYTKLIEASKEALNNAISILRDDVTLGEIGKIIHETINNYGYTPIKNLSGHGLDEYTVHCPPQIPNIDTGSQTKLKKGMYFAIEPFATNGTGKVRESGEAMIFSQINKKPVRDPTARKLLKKIEHVKGLPFTNRHFSKELSPARLRLALRQLKLSGNLNDYPPLVEVSNGIVAQTEHSFYIDNNGKVITLTK